MSSRRAYPSGERRQALEDGLTAIRSLIFWDEESHPRDDNGKFGQGGGGGSVVSAPASVHSVRGALSRAGITKGRASSAGFTIDHGARVEQRSGYVRVTHVGGKNGDAELAKYKDVLESKGFKVDMVNTEQARSTSTVPRLEIANGK